MNWDKEFLSSHSTADQDWANEYSEFTDTDFQSFLEGQKNTTTPAETAYTVNHSKWMLPSFILDASKLKSLVTPHLL